MHKPPLRRGGSMDAEEIKALVAKLEPVAHYICEEDCWYSCPKSGDCCEDRVDENKCFCWADNENKLRAEVVTALTAALEDRKDIEVDRAELRYWRNCNADIMRQKDRVDGVSHADRIADI